MLLTFDYLLVAPELGSGLHPPNCDGAHNAGGSRLSALSCAQAFGACLHRSGANKNWGDICRLGKAAKGSIADCVRLPPRLDRSERRPVSANAAHNDWREP